MPPTDGAGALTEAEQAMDARVRASLQCHLCPRRAGMVVKVVNDPERKQQGQKDNIFVTYQAKEGSRYQQWSFYLPRDYEYTPSAGERVTVWGCISGRAKYAQFQTGPAVRVHGAWNDGELWPGQGDYADATD